MLYVLRMRRMRGMIVAFMFPLKFDKTIYILRITKSKIDDNSNLKLPNLKWPLNVLTWESEG